MEAFKQLRRKFAQSAANSSSSSTVKSSSVSSSSTTISSSKVTVWSENVVEARSEVKTQTDLRPVKEEEKRETKAEKPKVVLNKTKPAEKDAAPKAKPPIAKKPIHKTVEKGQVPASDRKSSITDEKLQELQETFVIFDKNRDGMITKEELGAVLFALGQRPTVMEVQALIRSVDLDQSGTIDFDEFVKIFSAKLSIDPEQELHEVFDIFDQNSDGFICPDELYEMLKKLGEHITQSEAKKMINEADLNRDGKVDYREFKAILNAR
ncbi:CALM-like protein [Mya arenaria]|uniref:CALM-like protein n=1 Tax=Mya arenaria TaxID=6604 RepID=A0ABY7EUG0_MYAAR|nr:uncharacterized protein LOC128243708 [Mya arenaria]WAR12749.1 CALM-like protein [Mya arenaria]